MEQIKQLIADLLMKRAHIKQILKNFSDDFTEEEINKYLDRINQIEELIQKLREGLK